MIAHTRLRARRRSVALAGLLALASGTPAVAQTQLYLLTSESSVVVIIPVPNPECGYWDDDCDNTYIRTPVPGRVIQLDVDRLQIVAATPISHALGTVIGPHPTPDGRLLLWSGSNFAAWAPHHVSLFDVAGRQQATPLAGDGLSSIPLTVQPSEMRAFLQLSSGGAVTVAEPGHTRTLPPPPCGAPRLESQSGDGGRLSYYCEVPRSVMVADSADGHVLATVPLGASAFTPGKTSHVLDATGRNLFAVEAKGDLWSLDDLVWYRRFDVATGALLAERRGSANVVHTWVFNEAAGHLYAGTPFGILVIDATTLIEIGSIAVPLGAPHPGWAGPKIALDPEQPHAYIGWQGHPEDPVVRLSLVHTGTLATLGSMEISGNGALAGLALGPRPPRVSDLGALVGGGLVTLSWAIDTSRSIATGQLVEAGFSPGETVVRLPVDAGATSLTVPGVPPGRYYVRVRSVNGTGIGTPSNEVLVEVP